MNDQDFVELEREVNEFWPGCLEGWSAKKRRATFEMFRGAQLPDAKLAVQQVFAKDPDSLRPRWNDIVEALPTRRMSDRPTDDTLERWREEAERERRRFRDRWERLAPASKAEVKEAAVELIPEVFRGAISRDPHRDVRFRAFCSEAMDRRDGVDVPIGRAARFGAILIRQHHRRGCLLVDIEQRTGRKLPRVSEPDEWGVYRGPERNGTLRTNDLDPDGPVEPPAPQRPAFVLTGDPFVDDLAAQVADDEARKAEARRAELTARYPAVEAWTPPPKPSENDWIPF